MFWKLIRWGGTLVVMLLVIAATAFTERGEGDARPVPPVDTQHPNKNFNL